MFRSIDRRATTSPIPSRSGMNWRIAQAVAAAVFAGAGLARAQTGPAAPPPEDSSKLQEVVVTGIRYAAGVAVSEKQKEDAIVEVVTAEDIGKLPDPSVAESIARLPGISGQRVGGRIQDIAIRGFNGDYSETTLNGREQASTGDNRAVQFDQYPGEVVQEVMVYKTPDARRAVNSGVAGTVDIRTMRPLSYAHDVLAFGVRGERNSLEALLPEGQKNGYRLNATWIAKFADNTLGVGLAYARLHSPEEEQHYKSWWFGQSGPNNTSFNTTGAQYTNAQAFGLNGEESYNYSRIDVRDGFVGTIEWQPNERIHSVTDLYYSRYTQNAYDTGWEAFNITANGPTNIPGFFSVNNGSVISAGGGNLNPALATNFYTGGTWSGMQPIIISEFTGTHDRLFAIGENLEVGLGGGWRATADLSYSYAHREEGFLQQYAGYGPQGSQNGDLTISNAEAALPSFSTSLSYANAGVMNLDDAAPWGGWGHDGTAHNQLSSDKIQGVKLGADREIDGPLNHLGVGLAYQERNKARSEVDYNLCLTSPQCAATPYDGTPVPLSAVANGVTNLIGGFGGVATWNARAANSLYTFSAINDANQYSLDYSVKERLSSAFIQGDFKTSIGSVPTHGNIGGAVVHTQQSSTGFAILNNGNGTFTPVPNTQGTSYNDFLPSLNVIFDIADDSKARVSLARELMRPQMQQIANYLSASVGNDPVAQAAGRCVAPTPANAGNCNVWSSSGGNPALRPWRDNSLDISLEKYFAPGNYIALAGWYKDFRSYIYNSIGTPYDFSAYTPPNRQQVYTTAGTNSEPQSFSGGTARGLEATLVLDIGHFYAPLQGFGAQLSQAWTSSSIRPDPTIASGVGLPGLSPIVRNLTAYFERWGFSLRLSERYRDPYVGTVINAFGFRSYGEILADRQLDGSIGYSFQNGPLKGLDIVLQGLNLRNNPYQDTTGVLTYNQNDAGGNPLYAQVNTGWVQPQVYEKYGRTYLLGVTYKLQN